MSELRYLIVNADDLALHPSVNSAIFRAHRDGIVTSTTILVGGAAFLEAAKELKQHPELGVGIHLCLVEQRPVSAPEKIPSLLNARGRLWDSHAVFISKFILGRVRLAEVKLEFEAQLRRALDCGIKPTHLDSHQHLHLLPRISTLVAEIGNKFGIQRIRIPAEDTTVETASTTRVRRLQARLVSQLANYQRRRFERAGLVGPEHFAGFSCGGDFNLNLWRRIIPVLHAGVTEVMVHPGEDNEVLEEVVGSGYHWHEELQALLDPEIKSLLRGCGVQLIHYGDLS